MLQDSWLSHKIELLTDQSSARVLARYQLFEGLQEEMAKHLPQHMIPSGLLYVSRLPLTRNNKIDRAKLASLTQHLLVEDALPSEAQDSAQDHLIGAQEHELALLWRQALGNLTKPLRSRSSFLKCGGDSLAAMRLVGLARKKGFIISVLQVMSNLRLADMAMLLRTAELPKAISLLKRFAFVEDGTLREIRDTLHSGGIQWSHVQDAFPLISLQEHCLTASLTFRGDGFAQFRFPLEDVSTSRLQDAIRTILATHHSLRTRFVKSNQGFFQVICSPATLNDAACPIIYGVLEEAQDAQATHATAAALGGQLCWFDFVSSHPEQRGGYLLLTMHHGIYDGWSYQNLIDALKIAYSEPGKMLAPPVFTMSQLVQTAIECRNSPVSSRFWKDHLSNAVPSSPLSSAVEDISSAWAQSEVTIKWPIPSMAGSFTVSTMLHVALGMALRATTGSPRPILATTITGRESNALGISEFIGAAAVVVPLCVVLQRGTTNETLRLHTVMQQVQDFLSTMGTHWHFGFNAIAALSPAARLACASATQIVVHAMSYGSKGIQRKPSEQASQLQALEMKCDHARLLGKEREGLSIECFQRRAARTGELSVAVEARYDQRFITDATVTTLVHSFRESFEECVRASQEL